MVTNRRKHSIFMRLRAAGGVAETPRSDRAHACIETPGRAPTMAHTSIEWRRDADAALAEAKRAHMPVLIDFSAAPT
jgi:hypothetical protein